MTDRITNSVMYKRQLHQIYVTLSSKMYKKKVMHLSLDFILF